MRPTNNFTLTNANTNVKEIPSGRLSGRLIEREKKKEKKQKKREVGR
jgi:hypothetical protein